MKQEWEKEPKEATLGSMHSKTSLKEPRLAAGLNDEKGAQQSSGDGAYKTEHAWTKRPRAGRACARMHAWACEHVCEREREEASTRNTEGPLGHEGRSVESIKSGREGWDLTCPGKSLWLLWRMSVRNPNTAPQTPVQRCKWEDRSSAQRMGKETAVSLLRFLWYGGEAQESTVTHSIFTWLTQRTLKPST